MLNHHGDTPALFNVQLGFQTTNEMFRGGGGGGGGEEKNSCQHRGIEPSSAARWTHDAEPPDLHPHPI